MNTDPVTMQSAERASEGAKLRLEKKHPLAIRWFHWINFPMILMMVWSGILIYWANGVMHVGKYLFFADWFYHPGMNQQKPLYDLSGRLSEGMSWHFLFMWFFTINGLLYVLYTALSGEWRYLLPTRRTLAEAIQVVLHDLHLSKKPLPKRKFNGAQQIAYTAVVLMGLGSVITGIAIYKPVQASLFTRLLGGYDVARFFHFWLMMGFVGFFCIHIAQVIRAGWNNFRSMITGYEVVEMEAEK